MSQVVHFNGVALEVLEHNHSWALSNRQVAEGFGVSESTIREQKRANEYKDGVHFYVSENLTGNAMQTFWTKKGVITLGFKLRETPQTVAFRDWASDFIINPSHTTPASFSPEITLLQSKLAETITALSEVAKERDDFRDKYLRELEREVALLYHRTPMPPQENLAPKKGTHLSEAEKNRILRLHNEGLSKSEIARRTGRSFNAITRAIQTHRTLF